jgi:hypothetical protein
MIYSLPLLSGTMPPIMVKLNCYWYYSIELATAGTNFAAPAVATSLERFKEEFPVGELVLQP